MGRSRQFGFGTGCFALLPRGEIFLYGPVTIPSVLCMKPPQNCCEADLLWRLWVCWRECFGLPMPRQLRAGRLVFG